MHGDGNYRRAGVSETSGADITVNLLKVALTALTVTLRLLVRLRAQ